MIRCQVIENFTLNDYKRLKNIKRKGIDKPGELYVGDQFECDEEITNYLLKENKNQKSYIKILEIKPEVDINII